MDEQKSQKAKNEDRTKKVKRLKTETEDQKKSKG